MSPGHSGATAPDSHRLTRTVVLASVTLEVVEDPRLAAAANRIRRLRELRVAIDSLLELILAPPGG